MTNAFGVRTAFPGLLLSSLGKRVPKKREDNPQYSNILTMRKPSTMPENIKSYALCDTLLTSVDHLMQSGLQFSLICIIYGAKT